MACKTPIYYNDPKFDYQKYWLGREYENLSEKLALKKLLRLLPNKNRLLDIGGGFGRLVDVYAPLYKSCLLIDPSDKLICLAKKQCLRYHNLTLKKGFVEKIPISDSYFNAVVCIRTFHHLKNPDKAILEINRVLKPGGFLILEFANKNRLINIIRAVARGDFNFLIEVRPASISHKKDGVPFLSYHPSQIKTLLFTHGFKLKQVVSVSNFRNYWLKKIIPLKGLIFLDSLIFTLNTQYRLFSYFGPSIIVVARKAK